MFFELFTQAPVLHRVNYVMRRKVKIVKAAFSVEVSLVH